MFIVVPILQVWLAQNVSYLRSLPYLFAVAVISHHLRDGHRRGLWFWPLGSTPPLPYWVYIICMMALLCFVKDIKRSIEKFNVIPISRQNTPLMDVWWKLCIKPKALRFHMYLRPDNTKRVFIRPQWWQYSQHWSPCLLLLLQTRTSCQINMDAIKSKMWQRKVN